MVFSSPLFLFLFLPLFLGVYYLFPKARILWILVGSWVFYGLWRVDFLGLLILVTVGNWLAGLALSAELPRLQHRRKTVVALAVILNLLVLGYFKYANFGIDTLEALFPGLSLSWGTRIILPVGISFYIFQAMSYTIDVYRGDAPAARSFVKLAAYISFFPQLIAGPIVRYKDLSDQLDQPHVSAGRVVRGFRRFVLGLGKKILLADTLAPLVEGAFGLATPSLTDSWIGVSAYSLQLYFDFAAYSDMAIGLGLMLGFRFRENFRFPYHALSVTEFWQRWHMSLSTWLRDYLYIPLGGNRRSPSRTQLNLLLVMVLGGLWHGAAWNFVLWGLWHGAILLTERRSPELYRPGATEGWRTTVLRVRLLMIVALGWVFFRAPDLDGALRMVAGLLGGFHAEGYGLSSAFAWQVQPFALLTLGAGIVIAGIEDRKFRGGQLIWLLLVVSLMKLLADSYSPFLYFQF